MNDKKKEAKANRIKMVSRRSFLETSAMGLGAATLGLPAINSYSEAAEYPVVKSCYLPITDATPIILAHELGFYKEIGLKSERPILIRGWSPIAEAFMARRFNLTHLLLPIPMYMRFGLGFPVKVVAWDHINGSALTVGRKSGIKSYADCGGKNIAVPYWYSMHNIIMQLILRKYGIETVIQNRNKPLTNKQCNLFVMAPPDMPTAMATGAIDGYIVAEPFNAAGELLAKGTIVRFTGDIWKNHPCCVAVMQEEVVKNKDYSHKVIHALVKAELWAYQNTEKAAHIMSKDGAGYLPLPEKIIKRAMIYYDPQVYGKSGTGAIQHPEWNAKRWSCEPYQFRSTTDRVVAELKRTKMEGKVEFIQSMDANKVQNELMYLDGVVEAAKKLGGLHLFDGVNKDDPYNRVEVVEV
ncbi:MAG: ABC transporter substrate-binding protein [Candidatus Desulfatibia sp.]|uniref:ABC transporter substrate-binding protein n=1 Tax=Candidatus Desulfatibia sp. TaxID=3101189 RepID=UPI002F2F0204